MIFVFHLLDRLESVDTRQRTRPLHKDYLAAVSGRIAFAGPLLADDGITMVGSLLAIDFPSRAAAVEWLRHEPFTVAGLYGSVHLHGFANLWPQKMGFPVVGVT